MCNTSSLPRIEPRTNNTHHRKQLILAVAKKRECPPTCIHIRVSSFFAFLLLLLL
jgi:hypothetical protein